MGLRVRIATLLCFSEMRHCQRLKCIFRRSCRTSAQRLSVRIKIFSNVWLAKKCSKSSSLLVLSDLRHLYWKIAKMLRNCCFSDLNCFPWTSPIEQSSSKPPFFISFKLSSMEDTSQFSIPGRQIFVSIKVHGVFCCRLGVKSHAPTVTLTVKVLLRLWLTATTPKQWVP